MFGVSVVPRIKAGHVKALNFTKALNAFKKHCPPFHDRSSLKESLLPEATDFVTKSLPNVGLSTCNKNDKHIHLLKVLNFGAQQQECAGTDIVNKCCTFLHPLFLLFCHH